MPKKTARSKKGKLKNVKVVAIIPARGGSKSIPYKNIASVGGKPLIYYSIREAHRSKLIDATIISTDDEKIATIARSFGADVPFLRPKEISGDHARDVEFLKHAVEWLERERGWQPDIVLFLQPTSPSRTGEEIDEVLRFMRKTKCDSVRTVIDELPFHPMKSLVITETETMKAAPLVSFIPSLSHVGPDAPRQLLPKVVRPVGLVYATRTKFIKAGRVWGDDVRCYIVPASKCTDIDEPADLLEAEEVLRNHNLLED